MRSGRRVPSVTQAGKPRGPCLSRVRVYTSVPWEQALLLQDFGRGLGQPVGGGWPHHTSGGGVPSPEPAAAIKEHVCQPAEPGASGKDITRQAALWSPGGPRATLSVCLSGPALPAQGHTDFLREVCPSWVCPLLWAPRGSDLGSTLFS